MAHRVYKRFYVMCDYDGTLMRYCWQWHRKRLVTSWDGAAVTWAEVSERRWYCGVGACCWRWSRRRWRRSSTGRRGTRRRVSTSRSTRGTASSTSPTPSRSSAPCAVSPTFTSCAFESASTYVYPLTDQPPEKKPLVITSPSLLPYMGRLGSEPRLVGLIWSWVRRGGVHSWVRVDVSFSHKKIPPDSVLEQLSGRWRRRGVLFGRVLTSYLVYPSPLWILGSGSTYQYVNASISADQQLKTTGCGIKNNPLRKIE